jgi:hypothetical protein
MRSRELAIVAVLGALVSTAPAAAYTGSHPGRSSGSHAARPSGAHAGRSSGSHAARPSGAQAGRYSGSYASRPSGAYTGHSSGSYAARPLGAYRGRYAAGNPGRYPVSYPGHYPGRYPRYYPGRYPGYYPYSSFYWGVGFGWGLGQWGWGGGWGPWGWGWGGPWGPWGWGTAVAEQVAEQVAEHTTPEAVAVAQPDLAAVDTAVSPEHARVILDGQLIGVADNFDGSPDYLYLRPGHYTIEFQLGGYRSEKVEIDAKPGSHFPINLNLERIKGEKATPWYDRPEGLPVSRIFGPPQGAQAPPARPGPDPTLRPEFRQPPAPAPQAQSGTTFAALDLRVTPPNAVVYVDGTMVGTGAELGRLERGLAVAPGGHRIDVMGPGYASKSLEVDVKEGERQQIVVELDVGAGQNR